MHARASAHTHTYVHSHTYTRTQTRPNKRARTHTSARRHLHDTHAHIHLHADIHMTHAEGRIPPRVREPGNGTDSEGWAEERERMGMGYSESISTHTVITTTKNSGHDVHIKYNEQSRTRTGGWYVGCEVMTWKMRANRSQTVKARHEQASVKPRVGRYIVRARVGT